MPGPPTTKLGLPTMADSDRLNTVAERIRALADGVDADLAPCCGLAQSSAAQSIPHVTWTTVTLPTTSLLRGGMTAHALGGLTVPETGIYRVSGAVCWTTAAAGTQRAARLVTFDGVGSQILGGSENMAQSTNGDQTTATASRLVQITAGTGVFVQGWQASGAALNTRHVGGSDHRSSQLSVELVARL